MKYFFFCLPNGFPVLNEIFAQGPGDIGTPSNPSQDHSGPHAPLRGAGDDIWHPSEAADTRSSQDYDPREAPEYEMKFKQAVTAEDVYLGVSRAFLL